MWSYDQAETRIEVSGGKKVLIAAVATHANWRGRRQNGALTTNNLGTSAEEQYQERTREQRVPQTN